VGFIRAAIPANEVDIDNVLNTMRVQVTFSGLTSGNTASHIHCCIAPGGKYRLLQQQHPPSLDFQAV
jgi:hypothetical protein